jgi:hypothetical protein
VILKRSKYEIPSNDYEDLLTYLVEECWTLSLRHEPGGTIAFSTYATNTLSKRLIDWRRQRHGRTRWVFKHRVYERAKVELVSIDADDSSEVDWKRLSPEAAWTTVNIAWPMRFGCSISEVAGQVGETTGW